MSNPKQEFVKDVLFSPSRSWRGGEGLSDYGITTVHISFVLSTPIGAVDWEISTAMASEPVRESLNKTSPTGYIGDARVPSGCTIGSHSTEPGYEGQLPAHTCTLINPCYYNCSYCDSDKLIEGFLALGSKYVWEKLEEYYNYEFNDGAEVDYSFEHLPHPDLKKKERE